VNLVRRDLGHDAVRAVSSNLRESIAAGLEHLEEALEYALGFGRGMDSERGDRFIDMYVNELTQEYGDEGRLAVHELLSRAEAVGAYDVPVRVQFAP
jgi:1,4-dihydroxy-6-naphthoate synthase